MWRFVEDAAAISAREVCRVLPRGAPGGMATLDIAGVGAQNVQLTSTPGGYGGYLYWLLCPVCGRRAGKLYLPPGKEAFLCRRCHGLYYRAQMMPPPALEQGSRSSARHKRLELLALLKDRLRQRQRMDSRDH